MTETEIVYRQAVPEDFPQLAEMYERLNDFYYKVGYRLPRPDHVGQLWVESFQRTLGRFSNVYVAVVGERLIGMMLCRVKRLPQHMGGVLTSEFSDFWVEPEYRHGQVGDVLSQLTIEWLRQQGVHSIEMQVLKDNERILRYFERMGFQLEFYTARKIFETE